MKQLIGFSEIKATDLDQVGGKGLSLGLMTQAGLPVPPGFVVTTQVTNIEKIKAELLEAFDDLGSQRVAVRSSAVAEDSKSASWAGQFESYLNVERHGLIKAIQDCWASANGAQEYASTQDTTGDQMALAVVVQAMVDSEISGVAFSVNPVNRDANEIMIEATYGLGEPLVQGMVTPDNYVLAKDSGEIISSRIATKSTRLVYQDGQNKAAPVGKEQQNASCLSRDQITRLKDLIVKIEEYYGAPQDIEWAFAKGTFFIVQSRPITTL